MNTLNFQRLNEHAVPPEYKTAGAACFDIHALVLGNNGKPAAYPLYVAENFTQVIDTGMRFEIPDGYVLLVFSRGGHGFKHNVRLANCVGVIDSDYTGELKVKLTCDGRVKELEVKHGDAIAQGMLVPAPRYSLTEITEWSKQTARGDGGFGSTDKPTGDAFKAEVLNREDPFGPSGKHSHRLTDTQVQAEIDAGHVRLPGKYGVRHNDN